MDTYFYKGNRYIITDPDVLVKIDRKWVEGVTYREIDRKKTYVRTKEDFYSKFKKLGE